MKKITILLSTIFFLISYNLSAQLYWMEHGGSPDVDEGIAVGSDAAGNTYATGYFTNTAKFGSTILTTFGQTDIVLTKMNNLGAYVWAVQAGGIGSDRPTALRTDSMGNCYITGFYYGTATFGSFHITSTGAQDVFIAKYDSSGTCIWVRTCGGTEEDIGHAIALDPSGNVVVTGEFQGTSTFGTSVFTSMNNSVDIFTIKYDNNGTFLWAKQGAAKYTDIGAAVVCDASGNVYVTGQFSDTITFDYVTNCNMYNGIFLIKYNASGVEQWMKFSGGGNYNVANTIYIDQSGNPVIAGDLHGSITFFYAPTNITMTTTYPNNIFLAKYSPAGNLIWSLANGSNSYVTAKSLVIDELGNNYLTGNFACTFTQYADVYGQGTFCSIGFNDIYVSKWDVAGNKIWNRQVAGHADDNGTGIALNAADEILLTGSFGETVIFPVRWANFIGYADTVFNGCTPYYCNDFSYSQYKGLRSYGNSDMFVAKCLDTMRQPYDYFLRSGNNCDRPYDSMCLGQWLGPCSDSAHGCDSVIVQVNTFACKDLAPSYSFHWSNGSTNDTAKIWTSGWVYLLHSHPDACDTKTDSIYVTIYPIPPIPAISDNQLVNVDAIQTYIVQVCVPDSISIWASNYDPTDSIYWINPNNVITHDSSLPNNHVDGLYLFVVTNSYGCTDTNAVLLEFDSLLPPIHPKIIFPQDTFNTDTITLCLGNPFEAVIRDTVTGADCYPNTTIIWTVSPVIPELFGIYFTQYCQWYIYNWFWPSVSGWYTVTAHINLGNVCNLIDVTTSRSIYIVVLPHPTPIIKGDTAFCPGDSVELLASGGVSYLWGYNEFNTYYFTQFNTNQDIWVNQTGYYIVAVTNAGGCSDSIIVHVQQKPYPEITMNPVFGIICPNDSVLLTVSGNGTFAWDGPNGAIPGDTDQIYVQLAGQYYCYNVDTQGCPQLSNTVIVTAYNTPYLKVIPDTAFCKGDSVEIVVVTTPGSNITWLQPLSGDSLFVYVDTTDYYSCSVFSCNITTIAGVHVTMVTSAAQIDYTGSTTFCAGDSIVLSGNSGMTQYIWQPGNIIEPTMTAYTSGTYLLMTLDSLGCQAFDSVTITVTPAYYTPSLKVIPDSVFCIGQSVVLNVLSDSLSTIQWLNPLSGNSFQQVVDTTGTYICSVTYCNITTTDSITVTELNPAANITASGPLTFCSGDSITLTGSGNFTNYIWLPDSVSNQNIIVHNPAVYHLTITNYIGCTATDSIKIDTIPNPTPMVPSAATCAGTSITLIANGNQQVYWYNDEFATTPFDSGYTFTTPLLYTTMTYYILTNTGVCRSMLVPVVVEVEPCFINIPNIFTPNNDGYNDFFAFQADGFLTYHLIIYDRWGLKMFESYQPNLYWDGYDQAGRQCPDGTYYYIFYGDDYNAHPYSTHGYITLIR